MVFPLGRGPWLTPMLLPMHVITPNLVALSQTVWAPILGSWDPAPWDGSVADTLETRSCLTRITT